MPESIRLPYGACAGGVSDVNAQTRARRPQRPAANTALLLFALASLAVSMSVGQEEEIDVGSTAYWLLILPAALLPLANTDALVRNLLGRARLLLAMLVLGAAWHLAMGDGRAAIQLGLLVWVLAWVSSARASFSVHQIAWAFTVFVAAGLALDVLTQLNPWGLLPGRTAEEYGIWRVSFFPNIANTGMFSLFVLLLLTRDMRLARRHALVFALAMYFLVFSFVRTALIGAVLYVVLRWWFERPRGPRGSHMAWVALGVAVAVNLMIAASALTLAMVQDFPWLSRLLLRGESGLSADEIFQQLYRPWLWGQHLMLFADSSAMMGHGSFDFAELQTNELIEGHPGIGSDALPTRMLAAYGLAGALFSIYLVVRLRALARADDRWACAAFPTVVLLMMNWGSMFHPSNAFFVFFLLVATRGSRGVIDAR